MSGGRISTVIESTVRQCTPCQANVSQPSVAPLTRWMWPAKPWYRVHVDYAELEGQNFWVIFEGHSKWLEITLMKSTTASTAMDAAHKTFARFGIPERVITDNGPQFASTRGIHRISECKRCEAHWCRIVSTGKQQHGRIHGANVHAQLASLHWHGSSSSQTTGRFSAEVSNYSTFRDWNVAGKPDAAT